MSDVAVVIGAGIVGLHVARVLNEKGYEVYVLDQAPYLADGTSGRNSGVIHAGIYYESGSFKEDVCIEGNRLTYEWLRKLKVDHRECGKWVVAESGQEDELEPFFEKIRKLTIPSPELKSAADVRKEEPNLRTGRAILVPSTGIVDTAGYVKALAVYLEERGVNIILNCKVFDVVGAPLAAPPKVRAPLAGPVLKTTRDEIPFDLAINSAGLFSDEVARMSGLEGYEIRPCRGDYYQVSKTPLSRPVYHIPYPSTTLRAGRGALGLGVHLTPTLDGQLLLGPNAFFIKDKNDYAHHSDPAPFERAVHYYLPKWAQQAAPLQKAWSGNRPKLFHNGEPLPEFTIIKKDNWVHLLGIESPGLTAAPVLAEHVGRLLG